MTKNVFAVLMLLVLLTATLGITVTPTFAQEPIIMEGSGGGTAETQSLGPGEYEIAYDDGSYEILVVTGGAGMYLAERFTVPDPLGVPCSLLKAKYYLLDYPPDIPFAPFEVIVFHADGVTEYSRFTVAGPTAEGWYDVVFDPPITIYENDFYIAINYLQGWTNVLCVDGNSPSYLRSYYGPPMTAMGEGYNFMIRAVVIGIPVGGEIAPVNSIALLAPWIALATAAIALGYTLTRRKLFLH